MSYKIIEDNCTGCSACFRQCPVEAISGEFRETYTIDINKCIECGLCGMICPEEAILDPNGNLCKRVPRKERPRPKVDPEVCNACESCLPVCPFYCRNITEMVPFKGISALKYPDICTTCGECERICSKAAIRVGS